MKSPQTLSWTAKSAPSQLTYIEVIFQLSPSFFSDPENISEDTSIPLPMLPSAARRNGEYTSAEALEHIDELILHYRTVLALADRYRLAYVTYLYHFWLRLRLRSEDAEIEFAGYDSWLQMRTLFTWLAQAENRSNLHELGDGWEFLVARIDDRFHFRETGVDRSLRATNLAFPRQEILRRLAPVLVRVDDIISHLTDEFGEDYWTDFRRDLA